MRVVSKSVVFGAVKGLMRLMTPVMFVLLILLSLNNSAVYAEKTAADTEAQTLNADVAAELFRAYHKIESMQDNGRWTDFCGSAPLRIDENYFEQNGFSYDEKNALWHANNALYPRDFGDYTDKSGSMAFYTYSDAEREAIRAFYRQYTTAEFYEPRLEFIDRVTVRLHDTVYIKCMAHQYNYILVERPDTYANVRILADDGCSAVIAADFDMGVDSMLSETHEIRLMLKNAGDNGADGWKICGADWSSVILDAQLPADREELSEALIRSAVRALVDDVYIQFSSYNPLDDVPLRRYREFPELEIGAVKYLTAYFGLENRSVFETFLADFCSDDVAARLLAGRNAIERDGTIYFREYAPCSVNPELYRRVSSFDYTEHDGADEREKIVTFDLLTELTKDQFDKTGAENAVLTFVFTKTADGWKVTGGDFIDRLDAIFETGRAAPPSTGDETALIIVPALLVPAAGLFNYYLQRKKCLPASRIKTTIIR